jgi:hypothetical protein
MLLELQQIRRKLNIRLQEVLRIESVCLRVAAVFLDVQSDGRA